MHLPAGDTSAERNLYIDGSVEQIEAAKQLVNEVISEVCCICHPCYWELLWNVFDLVIWWMEMPMKNFISHYELSLNYRRLFVIAHHEFSASNKILSLFMNLSNVINSSSL